jgi:hypothetical protein
MKPQRSSGMTAVGVLNIIFGLLGGAAAGLAFAGGAMLASGAISSDEVQSSLTSGEAAIVTGLAGVLVLLFIVLFSAGIGVLRLAPSGRVLSLFYAWAALALVAVRAALNGPDLDTITSSIYPIVLIVLFSRPRWKAAFSGRAPEPEFEPVSDPFAARQRAF